MGEFRDLFLTNDMIYDVIPEKRSLTLSTSEGILLFRKRSLSQLLQLLGVSLYDYRMNPNVVKEALLKYKKSLVLGAVRSYIQGIDWYVFRTTSEQFTPIPHRMLFEFIEQVLRENGVQFERKEFKKWFRRAGMYYIIGSEKSGILNDVFDTGILVTNANTAKDGIHVMGIVKVISCDNSIRALDYYSIVHKHSAERIFQRVERDVLKAVKTIREKFPQLKARIEELGSIELSESIIRNWLEAWKQKAPKKYHKWFERTLDKYIKRHGRTELAVWQAETYLARRLQNKNISLAYTLQKSAEKRVVK